MFFYFMMFNFVKLYVCKKYFTNIFVINDQLRKLYEKKILLFNIFYRNCCLSLFKENKEPPLNAFKLS